MITRRKFIVACVAGLGGLVGANTTARLCNWNFASVNNNSIKGIFFTNHLRCFAIYWQRGGGFAITNWTNMRKQELPSAIAWWNGAPLVQRSIWRNGNKGIRVP